MMLSTKKTKTLKTFLLPFLLSFLVAGLSACGQESSVVNIDVDGAAAIKMAPPALLSTRAIDPENLRLRVTINGEEVPMTKNGETWTGATTVQKDSGVSLTVEWHE